MLKKKIKEWLGVNDVNNAHGLLTTRDEIIHYGNKESIKLESMHCSVMEDCMREDLIRMSIKPNLRTIGDTLYSVVDGLVFKRIFGDYRFSGALALLLTCNECKNKYWYPVSTMAGVSVVLREFKCIKCAYGSMISMSNYPNLGHEEENALKDFV